MLDFLNKKCLITNESDLTNIVNNVLNGDIKSYCDLKDYFLSRFPLINSDIKANHKKLSFNAFKNAADACNPYAQSFIGWLYWTGLCGEINDNLAVEYFSKAAKQHNAIGLTELGLINSIVGIDNNKPNQYTALNLFEEASQQEEATAYTDLVLGLYQEIHKGDYHITIHHLKKALSSEITAAAPELANIYLLKGSQDDSFELYALSPYHLISSFNLALFFYGDRAKCSIKEDQVRAFQCFLVAKVTGYPLAEWYLSFYRNSTLDNIGILFTKIEKQFMECVSYNESTSTANLTTPSDIFNIMKDDFEELYSKKIYRASLAIDFSLNHYVDYCYNHCLLSSILAGNLQLSISEKIYYSFIKSQFNKALLEILNN